MKEKRLLKVVFVLFAIGVMACIYFGYSYGHAILVWKRFDQSFHQGQVYSTPLWFENQVGVAFHWLIIVATYMCVTGLGILGIISRKRRKKV